MSANAAPDSTRLAADARRLVEQGDFAGAERMLLATLDPADPGTDDVDALYVLAVAQRYQKRLDAAVRTLERLLAVNPDHARAHQERGHVELSRNALPAARSAYEQAVARNPALAASWRALANLYDLTGEAGRAAHARDQAAYLDALPPALQAALGFAAEGALHRAEEVCRQFLRGNRQHVEGIRILADIGARLGVLADAEFLLETALELEPGNDRVRYDHANLLLKMQKFEGAHAQTERLVGRQPDNLAFLSLHANALAGIGEHREAIACYETVLARSPAQHKLHVMAGHAHKTIGELDAAIAAYRRAYEQQPDYGDAYWSLANTKTYVFTDDELERMERQEAAPDIETEDRVHVCFALGKAWEDRRDYERAFRFYERGNTLKAASEGADYTDRRVQAQIETCTAELFASRDHVGCPAPDPIFIVGLPRAGSTLLEQILASHSEVDGTLELPNIPSLAQRLRGTPRERASDGGAGYPKILETLEDDYFRRFGEQFLEQTRVYRQGARLFIDKNPNNFFHVGLIRLILPNAKIIDARRHPMACCVSGFKQLFGQGQSFTYGLERIGNYYRRYVELMEHWDSVLPGWVLRVQHEDVVDDLEGQVRRMLDFCGLSFEPACLEFHRTERSVRTPSSEQVRQPIYRTGLDAWQNFEPWLDPLKDALGPELRATYGIR